jgi:hypothetical protein
MVASLTQALLPALCCQGPRCRVLLLLLLLGRGRVLDKVQRPGGTAAPGCAAWGLGGAPPWPYPGHTLAKASSLG